MSILAPSYGQKFEQLMQICGNSPERSAELRADLERRDNMSALVLSELTVVPIGSSPKTVIRAALEEHCRGQGLGFMQTEAVIDSAIAAHRVMGASPAMAIEEGRKTAAAIKRKTESAARYVDRAFEDGVPPPRAA